MQIVRLERPVLMGLTVLMVLVRELSSLVSLLVLLRFDLLKSRLSSGVVL